VNIQPAFPSKSFATRSTRKRLEFCVVCSFVTNQMFSPYKPFIAQSTQMRPWLVTTWTSRITAAVSRNLHLKTAPQKGETNQCCLPQSLIPQYSLRCVTSACAVSVVHSCELPLSYIQPSTSWLPGPNRQPGSRPAVGTHAAACRLPC